MAPRASGGDVPISRPIQRIVVLNSDSLEALRILKSEDLVTGVFSELTREKEFWGGLAAQPKVGSWRDPDMETIASLNPDLVMAYSWAPGPMLEQKMALFGIRVLRLDFYKVDKLEHEVRVLGRILKREKEAERFCSWHGRYLGMIEEKTAGMTRRPRVYVESYTDYHAAGPGSGGNAMCARAGGGNIASGLSIPYPRVTPEWVVSCNPEVIIKAASFGKGYESLSPEGFNERRKAILERPAWDHIHAVSSGKVYVLDSSVWTGPRAIVGIAYMARWIHPDLFSGHIDPEAIHKEYLETFQGMAYKGVFVSDGPGESIR